VCGTTPSVVITEDEWVLLVQALGSIKVLKLYRFAAALALDFPFQAVAEAVNYAFT
jgi:hypothetical protein